MNAYEIEMYDYMVESGITTAEELNLARNLVDGEWSEVLSRVLYIRTGYHTLEQMMAEEEED